jgi:hypothetical protein
MSDTIVDMPKVTQMFDAGWYVRMWKNGMGSYEAQATHKDDKKLAELAKKLEQAHNAVPGQTLTYESEYDWTEDDDSMMDFLITDDFTPEQALTRLAYKTFGEII